ncbi:MAG: AhpC/TSA family protein [Bacteroidales bacterium]|nr:AhpC/TSA family protein [Bacteroidales bacterium]
MKIKLLLLSLLIVAISCNNSERIRISGKYNGNREGSLYLTRVDINRQVLIDSVKPGRTGHFSFNLESRQTDYYNLGFDNSEFITLIASPGDRIDISFNGSPLQDDYTVNGSTESEKVRLLDMRLAKARTELDSLSTLYSSSMNASDRDTALLSALEEEYTEIVDRLRMENIAFILDNLSSFSAIKALYQKIDDETYVLYRERDLQYMKLVSDSLSAYFPGSRQARALASNVENEINSMYLNRITALAESVEETLPDLALPSVTGDTVLLSSFRGKGYVLLSFWSARSEQSVSGNMELKEYFNKYHNKGFQIYQVNIDDDENLWRNAVRYDELPWISVRDYNEGLSPSISMFNISSVPANYLIDPEGNIIAKDLFGRSLQIKLSQIFNQGG